MRGQGTRHKGYAGRALDAPHRTTGRNKSHSLHCPHEGPGGVQVGRRAPLPGPLLVEGMG